MITILLLLFTVCIVCSCLTLGLFLIKARRYDLKYHYIAGSAASFVAAIILIKLMLS